jgi:hypothetical protein
MTESKNQICLYLAGAVGLDVVGFHILDVAL